MGEGDAPDRAFRPSCCSWVFFGGVLACVGFAAHVYYGLGIGMSVVVAILAPVVLLVAVLSGAFLLGAPGFFWAKFRRDRDARALVASMPAGAGGGHVILFLRQFDPVRGWSARVVEVAPAQSVFDDEFSTFGTEKWVREVLAGGGVVKVADRVDAYGGSVRFADERWQQEVDRLILAADSILLIPGLSEGVLWETVRVMAHGRMPRTTVMMPFGDTSARIQALRWGECQVAYAKLGIELPPFDLDGLLMKFNASGALVASLPVAGASPDALQAFVRKRIGTDGIDAGDR